MFNLIRLKEELEKAKNDLEYWKQKGTDTLYLTYKEQLELYQLRVDRLAKRLKKEMK